MSKKSILIIASLSGALAVILGALGAHALKNSLSIDQLTSYKTGSLYHLLHTVVLLGIGLSSDQFSASARKVIAGLFISGILLFSGSIYLLSTKELLGLEFLSFLGPITPLGGLTFIAGWISIAIFAIKKSE